MDHLEIFKALANPVRMQILHWLKDPEQYFPDQKQPFEIGVCVGQIKSRSGLTQSTVSEYLSILQRAGLVTSTRVGQWTLYKRNEEVFDALGSFIQQEL